jgi:uncharacterized protein involved in outer membrane biogenesis
MKKAIIAFAVLLVLVAVAAFIAYERIDLIVKLALEHYGPEVTGTSVRVGDVEISPRTGRGRLKYLEIGTPPGFSSPRAAHFKDVILELEAATVRTQVVHVTAIGIDAPAIVYERGDKTTNLDIIARNIEAYSRRAGEADGNSAAAADTGKRRFIIDRLLIRGAKVTMTSPSLRGQGVTFDLGDLELRDIGRRQGGVTASQASSIVANAVIAKIAQRVLSNIDLLRKGGVEGALDALKGLIR